MNDQQRNQGSHDDDDAIVPVDFAPLAAEQQQFKLPFTTTHVVIAAVLAVFIAISWFVLTARSVSFEVLPKADSLNVSGALSVRLGTRFLIRQGDVTVTTTSLGYRDYTGTFTITDKAAQTFTIAMEPLPGLLDLDTGNVTGAEVSVDGKRAGVTPMHQLELAAGDHQLLVKAARYEDLDSEVKIKGRAQQQSLSLQLVPAWADIAFNTNPVGATVTVDGEDVGKTPLTAQIVKGEHEVVVKLAAHKAWTNHLTVVARVNQTLPDIKLEPANGLVMIKSTPSGAAVTIDGVYKGVTPVEVTVTPSVNHQATLFVNGYQEAKQQIHINPAEEGNVNVTLEPILSNVTIKATPADAELFVNGVSKGKANQSLQLLAASQTIEIKRDGYVPYSSTFISRPGMDQQLNVTLKTLEQQKQESIKPEITTINGQKLKLIKPGNFVMGASRREAGRQANEVIRNVALTKPFYMSLTEVTNEQYAKFDAKHSSGAMQGHTLSNPTQPVVRVGWEEAVRYCNWLSEQEHLQPFYRVEGSKIVGINRDSKGYRLPLEAEWEWAARVNGDPNSLLRFPWGAELPPPDNFGNFADISAGNILGRVLSNYNDGYIVTAPVASFAPNANGFYDMGGNVAEWVNDYYGTTGTTGSSVETDPVGPDNGTYHVIRGSSWAHGSVTELRLSFRDFGNATRDDLGFRIARYLGD
ncbi:MAG TPA: PEGA domain-containing protein [Candidatus Acidoferrum sp.]|nr:PEGA domain-containing protein [Candidatus Acidoferrum sp.]